jgi:hypothetical protein
MIGQAMTLGDLRKFAIRKQFRVRFALRNGMECVIGEDGVVRIPALKVQPDFKLETDLDEAASFVLEPVTPVGQKNPPKPRSLTRAELVAMTSESPSSVAVHDEHDDE